MAYEAINSINILVLKCGQRGSVIFPRHNRKQWHRSSDPSGLLRGPISTAAVPCTGPIQAALVAHYSEQGILDHRPPHRPANIREDPRLRKDMSTQCVLSKGGWLTVFYSKPWFCMNWEYLAWGKEERKRCGKGNSSYLSRSKDLPSLFRLCTLLLGCLKVGSKFCQQLPSSCASANTLPSLIPHLKNGDFNSHLY